MLLVILVLLCAPRQTVPRTTAASGHSGRLVTRSLANFLVLNSSRGNKAFLLATKATGAMSKPRRWWTQPRLHGRAPYPHHPLYFVQVLAWYI